MIIVTGSLVARADAFDELLRLSQAHVARSRTEPGCVAHGVSQDTENALRLVFFEEWTDRDALATHFAVAESRAFVKAVAPLVTRPPAISIYDAQPIRM